MALWGKIQLTIMSIITIEGFKVYVNGRRSIIINSDAIAECMRIYDRYKLDGVAITTSHDYRLHNVDFLSEYPEIEHLSISDRINDVSAIHDLNNLKTLVLSGKGRKVDFAHFPMLTELNTDWSPKFINIGKCEYLNRLSLWGYNPKTKDCSTISDVPWIKRLMIAHSSIVNLKGLEKFTRLEEIAFDYCNKLETLCCLEESKESLVSLRFDHCKSITNHDYVVQLNRLGTLAYNNGGTLPSIKFIKKMASLENFMFMGTDVTDGDMTPCIGLKYAAFTNKKHFSHTMEQIKSL